MKDSIIDNVLDGTASRIEGRIVAQWFATKEGQKELSNRLDTDFNKDYTAQQDKVSESQSVRMKSRFAEQLAMRGNVTKHNTKRTRYLIAAALIPFIILTGVLLFVASQHGAFSNNDYAELAVPAGEQAHIVLADGTNVHLNSGSILYYPKTFGTFKREVKLEGEGYFEVAKEKTRRFVVHCNEISITVTGTKFNAKNYRSENKISVSLEEGSVNITDENNSVYSLQIAQKFDYDKITGLGRVSNVGDVSRYMVWRSGGLNFYRTPFSEIIGALERQHDLQFIVKDTSLLNYKFSISTNKVNTDEILADLEKVSNVKFVASGEKCYEVVSR